MKGHIPPSREKTYFWPSYQEPPRHYWKLWSHFLLFHIKPLLTSHLFSWDTSAPPNYCVTMFYHSISNILYKRKKSNIFFFKPAKHQHRTSASLFDNVEYITDQPFTPSHVIPMDSEYTREGIKLVGESNINCHKYLSSNTPLSLIERFHTLDPAFCEHTAHSALEGTIQGT
jgi:hypothetical protein